MALNVSKPTVTSNGDAGLIFSELAPLTIACEVTFDDGSLLSPELASDFSFQLLRTPAAGGETEAWDEDNKLWASLTPAPSTQAMFYQDGKWQTILVAAGQQDIYGAPKMATDRLTRYPKYRVGCLFATPDDDALYANISADFEVLATSELDRAGLAMYPKEASQAESIYLFLKDSSLIERGRIEILRSGSGYAIELTVSGSMIAIDPLGNISLGVPAGRTIHLSGNVTVDGLLTANGGIAP